MYDVAVIGGGIIGLAAAYKYQQNYPSHKIILVEKESELATHQTGNNSGVIHSGIYYKPGSLKAKNCRKGIQKLLEFCNKNEISYELCGKLIVATNEEELSELDALYQRGIKNGISDLRIIDRNKIQDIEPYVKGLKGIHSPSTGIINYKEVCEKCASLIKNNDGIIKTSTKVQNIKKGSNNNILETNIGDIEAKLVINCSGLYSDRVAKFTEQKIDVRIIPFRGEYFGIRKERRYLVKNLIYPVPNPKFPFLGVHFTRRIDGTIEAGPNAVLAFAREGYKKSNINVKDLSEIFFYSAFWKLGKKYWRIGSSEMLRSYFKFLFVNELKKIIPDIKSKDIIKGGSGVRAQALTSEGVLLDDFRIVRNNNIIHVLNAPSPAATSAFAIAENIISYVKS